MGKLCSCTLLVYTLFHYNIINVVDAILDSTRRYVVFMHTVSTLSAINFVSLQ